MLYLPIPGIRESEFTQDERLSNAKVLTISVFVDSKSPPGARFGVALVIPATPSLVTPMQGVVRFPSPSITAVDSVVDGVSAVEGLPVLAVFLVLGAFWPDLN